MKKFILTTLTTVSLTSTLFASAYDAVHYLEAPQFQPIILHLSGRDLRDVDALRIIKKMHEESFTHVDLSNNLGLTDELVFGEYNARDNSRSVFSIKCELESNHFVTSFDFSGTRISFEGIKAIIHYHRLCDFYLDTHQVNQKTKELLAANRFKNVENNRWHREGPVIR